jgi:hypothetical protein
MGTTFQHRARGTSDREFFQGLMGERYTILDCATISPRKDGAFYAAVRTNEGEEADKVWAFIALVHWVPGEYNFGYKDMDERMGPNAAECPARILDLLSSLPECSDPHPDYCGTCAAREWRASCQVVAANRERAAKVRPGQVVRFTRPITFTSGAELDTLTFKARDTFEADGRNYRIGGWRTASNWELVSA